MGKHSKPKNRTAARRAATVSAAAVTVPTLALTFAPHALAETTQAMPRVPGDAPEASADTPAAQACEDYIVNRGDNLSEIASRYGVDLSELESLNPGIIAGPRPDDYSLIFRGGHVHLPDGHCTPVAPTWHHHPERPGHHRWYRNCDDAPPGLHRGDPGYRHALDMDGDGKACEGPWPPSAPVTPPPSDPTDPGTTDPTTPPVVTPPSNGGSYTPVIAPDCPDAQSHGVAGAWTPGPGSGYCAHSVEFWRPLVEQAESIVPLAGGEQTDAILYRIQVESSGDPNVVNDYDSNWQQGIPSKGLMQTIDPTFSENHEAGTSTNVFDPLANLCAALNYINAVYGGVVPSGATY